MPPVAESANRRPQGKPRQRLRAAIDPDWNEAFQLRLLDWYAREQRDLPWRRTENPYQILVSEIMLHQTTVRTVIPYYERFLERYPTIRALAEAPLEEIKAITDPLGYKVRGQWLKRIAEEVVAYHDGQLPDTVEGLMALPGIGRYTAGAVASFAYRQDAPIADTNVIRLVSRLFALPSEVKGAQREKQLWALAEAIIPIGKGYVFNQALMDFGAQLCTARKPLCLLCPLLDLCQSRSPRPTPVVEFREG